VGKIFVATPPFREWIKQECPGQQPGDECKDKNKQDCQAVGADDTAENCKCSWNYSQQKCLQRSKPGMCI
tara:strand:+ start:3724 stop:3933 length:210 start_codon:yes stop_codon:yes gene_type:complete